MQIKTKLVLPFSHDAYSAFYMLATGPLAEFDVVAVNIDVNPVVVEEAPPLCGFIGYCPESFVFGSPSISDTHLTSVAL